MPKKKLAVKARIIKRNPNPLRHKLITKVSGCPTTTRIVDYVYRNGELVKRETRSEKRKATKLKLLESQSCPPSFMRTDFPQPDVSSASNDQQQPGRGYYHRKEMELSKWIAIRDSLLEGMTKHHAPETRSVPCHKCDEKTNRIVRCLHCGPSLQWCKDCAEKEHEFRPFHVLEQWMGSMFISMEKLPSELKLQHQCQTEIRRHIITVVISDGRLVKCRYEVCGCMSAPECLMEHHLWASSVASPTIAYSLDLMRQAEVFMLEARVSLKAFCLALRWKNNLSENQFQRIYRTLTNESFEEYRHVSYKMSSLQHLKNELDDGTVCPACPKDPAAVRTIAMDGNFGLVRKKSSGASLEPPKHGTRLFMSDAKVREGLDTCVEDADSGDKECSSFQAGQKIRAKNKSKNLDVTGVFGSICKHEIPMLFMDLHHGERLAYPVMLTNEIIARTKQEKLHLLYDIACKFDGYLKNHDGSALQDKLSLAIPIFHCYGHKVSCQLKYSPRVQSGFGFVDGEDTERLWSYARPFSPILKEMTPSHRVDLLTDLMLHYGKRKKDCLERTLETKLKAVTMEETSLRQKISEFSALYRVDLNEQVVKKWDLALQSAVESQTHALYDPKTWQETYALNIRKSHALQEDMHANADDEDHVTAHLTQLNAIHSRLQKLEKQHSVSTRWAVNDAQYLRWIQEVDSKLKATTLNRMLVFARERQFLLSLKEKYANGQSIATRIANQIKQVTMKLKKNLKALNTIGGVTITEKEALNPVSPIYLVSVLNQDCVLPSCIQRQGSELWNRCCRMHEEIHIIKEEMTNVSLHYLKEHNTAKMAFNHLTETGQSSSSVLMFEHMYSIERRYRYLSEIFGWCVKVPPMEYYCSIAPSENLLDGAVEDDCDDELYNEEEESDESDNEMY